MKVLFVAPKLCSPWSEGRKKFVRDLLETAAQRWDCSLLATFDEGERAFELQNGQHLVFPVRRSYEHLLELRRNFKQAMDRFEPDLVVHFPFGAFAGIRSLGNLWIISAIQSYCRRRHVPEITLMYSVTSEASSALHRRILDKTWRNQYSGHHRRIRFGVALPPWDAGPRQRLSKRLLFMAGMAEPTRERLDYVLSVRGLSLLLRQGERLRSFGCRLTVAVPILDRPDLVAILRDAAASWDSDVEFIALASVPGVFLEHDVFIFPYAREEIQFVPTSVVEALHYGTPVVLPRLEFLRPFHGTPGRVVTFSAGDGDELVSAITSVLEDEVLFQQLSANGREFIDREYNIEASIEDIEAIHASLVENG
jgi:glycosyltransferase involved in cell wall biosynthesis